MVIILVGVIFDKAIRKCPDTLSALGSNNTHLGRTTNRESKTIKNDKDKKNFHLLIL